MSSFFEEDSNGADDISWKSDDYSWRYDVANSDYGFLIFCLENNDVENLRAAVEADNQLNEKDQPAKKGGGLFSILFDDKPKKEEKGFWADIKDTAKSIGSGMDISRCKKEVVSRIENIVANLPVDYRVEAQVAVEALCDFYTRNARIGETRESHFKPLIVDASSFRNAQDSSGIRCMVLESAEMLGKEGLSLKLSFPFLQEFYSPLDPSTHLSTYSRLLNMSKSEVANLANSTGGLPKLILDPKASSVERGYQCGFLGKRIVPDNEMIVVNIDGHQGGLIVSKNYSSLFTL